MENRLKTMIGEAFRQRRKKRHLTQVQVAELLEIGTSTVRRYEENNLHYAMNDSLEKLDNLNKAWTLEDYENKWALP